ncbi:hypothetical protein HU200_020812 [Digitaria exilis]|uniref:Uncharacterized protein n=1 Tax=Digitaria exilis TaxID=1010633 RepID=A0A835KG05_9POAL|nr:hypothetical protein HU200_020812 [Digitaria exilis]
MTRTNPEMI